MVQTIENAAIENNNINNVINVIANVFKEKAVMPWYKQEQDRAAKGKAAFKKAAQSRLEYFLCFDDLDKAVKEAKTLSEDVFALPQAEDALLKACKTFGEGGKLHELQTRTFALAQEAAKADPLGQTPMAALGVGLGLDDEGSFSEFKTALVQAVIWASRQVKNEAAQAKAKAEADKKAMADVEKLFEPIYGGDEVEAWTNDRSSDEEFLRAGKVLILRAQSVIRTELRTIDEQGSGSTARARAILDEVDVICSDMEQGLSDKALHSKDKDGSKIWGQPSKLQIGTTARKIIEAAQIKLSALHSKADRTLSRLSAMEGAAKIVW